MPFGEDGLLQGIRPVAHRPAQPAGDAKGHVRVTLTQQAADDLGANSRTTGQLALADPGLSEQLAEPFGDGLGRTLRLTAAWHARPPNRPATVAAPHPSCGPS